MSSSLEIRVTRVPLPPLALLEREWRELEAKGEHSFFMSWHWIGSWLELLPADVPCFLMRAELGQRVVGLGVICESSTRRHGVFRSRGLHLSCTGRAELDELTVEYNGFLAEDGLRREVAQKCVRYLRGEDKWDELYLSGWHQIDLVEAMSEEHLGTLRITRRNCHYVDLDALRSTGRSYPECLPKNIQYNLRRSIRDYGKRGELKFDVATTSDEALAFLTGLKALHQRSWQAHGQPGAFANAFFDSFHERLVQCLFPAGLIQLTRLRVADQAIGYFYNFLYRGHVYHYQSGLDFEFDGKLSPGTVCHAYAVEFNLESGQKIYDFMAGELRYKKDHATHSTEMLWLVLQKPRLKFRIEDRLRALKARLSVAGADKGG